MSTTIFNRCIRMILLLVVQLVVMNHIHLLGYGTPIVIGCLTMKFHRNASRTGLLLWGFATGLLYDIFSNTMGMGMASCTLLAMLQPALLHLYMPRDAADDLRPSMHSMGRVRYLTYALTTLLLFHITFYALDAFTIANWQLTLLGIGIGTAIAFIFAWLVDLMTNPKAVGE